jgi:hypothetical protein
VYRSEDFQARLRARPFRPFRILAAEGPPVEVVHPGLVLVGRDDLIIGSPDPADHSLYEEATRVSFADITAVEELPDPDHAGPGKA